MKLAVYQAPTSGGDVAAALARLEPMMTAAAQAGARMLVAPELLLPGYNCADLHGPMAQPLDGPWMRALQALARRSGCGGDAGLGRARRRAGL